MGKRRMETMKLIGASILIGYMCALFGGALVGEGYSVILGIVGFLTPGLYVLDQVYEEVKKFK